MVWEHVTRTNLLLQVFTFQKVREGQLCGNVESGEFLWEVGGLPAIKSFPQNGHCVTTLYKYMSGKPALKSG